MQQEPNFPDLPLGFGMALGQHPGAMERFAALSVAEKKQVVAQAHQIQSKGEMQNFVQSLAEDHRAM